VVNRSVTASVRLAVGLLALLVSIAPSAHAQDSPPCGVVDAFDYPIDISDTLREGYDDFGMYRARFGGMHTGIDIGFRRWGEPVHAAARGRVTYADPEGWDTEKGVVVIEHTMPDSSLVYTVYGHMEQSETLLFPPVGFCVERGEVIGGIGWPSRGLPHLHYEIRSFMPDDGGPGYVPENPILDGWYHPLDFTQTWRARLSPGFVGATSYEIAPDLPPVQLDSGVIAIAKGNAIEGVYPPHTALWRITTDGDVTGLAALSGDRVVAHTRNGQSLTLQGGRYVAVWQVDGQGAPFVALGEMLVFLTDGGGLAAYDASGTALWTLPGNGLDPERVLSFEGNGDTMALSLRLTDGYTLLLVNNAGQMIYQAALDTPPVTAPGPKGSWWLLDGASVDQIADGKRNTLGSTGEAAGRSAQMTVDILGNSYIYLDDSASTLLSIGAAGEARWRIAYPAPPSSFPPLLDTGNGCMLYTLDTDGTLSVFSTADGAMITQETLYAGGSYTGNPRARLIDANNTERLLVSSGFLSLITLDGHILGGDTSANCLLG
jgi:murein DD-endopeptidase MepM/ murein hydrolase activator NlpD